MYPIGLRTRKEKVVGFIVQIPPSPLFCPDNLINFGLITVSGVFDSKSCNEPMIDVLMLLDVLDPTALIAQTLTRVVPIQEREAERGLLIAADSRVHYNKHQIS
jgi:hypothetical protein